MTKYQEALDHIIKCDREDCGMSYLSDAYRNDLSVLQELVEKATPKKPSFDKSWEYEEIKDIYNEDGSINECVCLCPNCHKHSIYDSEYGVRFDYCHECGQALDWSDKDD